MYHAGDKDNNTSTGASVGISIVITFIITLVVTTLISVIITRMYYKQECKHKESVKENSDVYCHKSEFVQTKQYHQEGIDYEGYIIPQKDSGSGDSGQIYDTINN